MKIDTLRNPRLVIPTAALAAIAFAGCSSGERTPAAPASAAASTEAGAVPTTRAAATAGAAAARGTIMFVAHGGIPTIDVYRDPSEAGRGSIDGGFKNGDIQGAICQIEGRRVPRVKGEEPLPAAQAAGLSTWYETTYRDENGDPTFASATYADVIEGAPLPVCSPSVVPAPTH